MSFMDQVESWEVVAFLLCALVLGSYFASKVDWENLLQKDSPTPVHMGGELQPSHAITGIQVVPIPDSVYESLETDTKFKRYLTGNHKYVYFFTYPGCPYARAFTNAFKQLFEKDGFSEYYRKRIQTVGRTTSISCPGHRDLNCATAWVYHMCFGKLCIFNPVRRQVVVDGTQNARQIEALLERFREW